MRNLTAGILAEVAKENFTFFFLLELQLTATYYYTDAEFNVYNDGNLFTPVPFKFTNIAGSASLAVESIDIEIDDTNQGIGAIILNEDIRNKWAIIYFGVISAGTYLTDEAGNILTDEEGNALLDESAITPMTIQEFTRGIIGGWEMYEDSIVKITITNEFVLWNKHPLRTQSASCPWTFKGTECAYSGSVSSCDQSWGKCKSLGNHIHFGGDRFLSSLLQKEIWWGKTQTV